MHVPIQLKPKKLPYLRFGHHIEHGGNTAVFSLPASPEPQTRTGHAHAPVHAEAGPTTRCVPWCRHLPRHTRSLYDIHIAMCTRVRVYVCVRAYVYVWGGAYVHVGFSLINDLSSCRPSNSTFFFDHGYPRASSWLTQNTSGASGAGSVSSGSYVSLSCGA